jgi:hypothetical protein
MLKIMNRQKIIGFNIDLKFFIVIIICVKIENIYDLIKTIHSSQTTVQKVQKKALLSIKCSLSVNKTHSSNYYLPKE